MSDHDGFDGKAQNEHAEALRLAGNLDEAASLYADTLARRPGSIQAILGAARCALQRGELAQAVELFNLAAARGNAPWPLLELGTSCLEADHVAEAEASFRGALALAPDLPAALRGLVVCARRRGDRAAAIATQKQLIAVAPDNALAKKRLNNDIKSLRRDMTILREKSAGARRRGEIDAALHLLAEAAALDPTAAWPLIDTAGLHAANARPAQARESIRQALARDPASVAAWQQAGLLEHAARDPAAALRAFERAQEIAAAAAGNDPTSLLELATACLRAGYLTVAEASYRAAAAIGPATPEALRGLAMCARKRGDAAAALDAQRQLVAVAPDNTDARKRLERDQRAAQHATKAQQATVASVRREAGAHAALPLVQAAIAADPDAVWPLVEAASLLRESGARDDAYGYVRRALRRDPNAAGAWLELAMLSRADGDGKQALDAFERAHVAEPDNVRIIVLLARQHRSMGNRARSRELLDRAEQLDPRRRRSLPRSADRALAADDPQTALGLFEQGIARHPDQLGHYLGAATAHARLGHIDAALAVLDQAVQHCGNSAALVARRAQLLADRGLDRQALAQVQDAWATHRGDFALWETGARLPAAFPTDAAYDAWLQQAPAAHPREQAILATLAGEAALDRGDNPQAIARFQAAAALQPAEPSHHGDLARAYLNHLELDRATIHVRAQAALQAGKTGPTRAIDFAQTPIGQIINEFRLDPPVLQAVLALQARAAADHDQLLPALQALCQAYPDSTLAAAALTNAVWRGRDAVPSGQAGPATIPPRIAQYWDGDVPPTLRELMDSWPALNPAAEYQRFDDRAARAFLADHFDRRIVLAYHKARTPALRSALFRLAILAHDGGVFADAALRCTAPLAAVLPVQAALVVHRDVLGLLSTEFIAATAAHPALCRALEQATMAIARDDRDARRLSIGAGLLTRCAAHQAVPVAGLHIWSANEAARRGVTRCDAMMRIGQREIARRAQAAPAP